MIRVLVFATLVVPIGWSVPVSAEVKGYALVQVRDPARGSLPDIVTAYGIVESENTLTRSFQRDGSDGDTTVIEGDVDPQRKLVLSGNYQIADGDALRTEEVPRVSQADGNSKKQED